MRYVATAWLVSGVIFAGQSAGPEFDVASIKRNTTAFPSRPTTGSPAAPSPTLGGQVSMSWVTPRILVQQAYPLDLTPPIIFGLPDWADSEHYDVVARSQPNITSDALRLMWRSLLAGRMKLADHYEMRPRQVYALVLARPDRRLGPQLRPTSVDCAPLDPATPINPPNPAVIDALRRPGPPPPNIEQQLMSACRSFFNGGGTVYSGGIEIRGLLLAIRVNGGADRPIIDRTGLAGLYAMKLSFSRPTLTPPGPDDPPSLFVALQDQLGLKLEPMTIDGQVLVIDHVERPSED